MTAPVINPSGYSTPGRLRCVDLNLTFPLNTGAPVWTPIQYIESTDFNPDNPNMVDAGVYGNQGASASDKLGYGWTLSCVLNHMVVPGSNPPAYDPTHVFLEAHAINSLGPANVVGLRIYDYDLTDPTGVLYPRGQAYTGFANYSWPGFGSVGEVDARKITIPFIGHGPLTPISHPYPAVAQVPLLTSMQGNPLAVAGSAPFRLTGQYFTGTTGVTIAGAAATSFKVWSDNEITGVAPAHAAATGLPVVVTNATGASTTGATLASYA